VDGAGLQTGDASLNIEAPVVVMTTEILRNMLYRVDEEGRTARDGLQVTPCLAPIQHTLTEECDGGLTLDLPC
jgi:hypothetical protein